MITLPDILSHYYITPQFPPAAVLAAQKMPREVSGKDLKGRLDLTKLLTFTIDGDDAKDFDDAVSLEKTDDGNYILGVHIADVSHYVTEGSPIDSAAFSRGTSVYLIDTVIPMLPFELSNGLCSLNPNVIRLTLSVFMEITPRGKVKDYSIHESFIKSKYRMTYNNVTKILEKDKELSEKYEELVPVLKDMLRLSEILNKKRIRRGAIEFVTNESKITLDKNGVPTQVERYPLSASNSVIEEFMLAANETVAKHMKTNKIPSVYRVHEEPSPEKIERLLAVLPVLGVENPLSDGRNPKDFQKIIEGVQGKENENIVNYIVLRSMSKAKYSELNLGHFGLAAEYYCHFTSPIRRYPDLMVHRILKASIHKKLDSTAIENYAYASACAAVSSTSSEINAQDTETEWKKIKKIQYMEDKTGEIFEGNISHVTANGFFVELDNTIEGFVPARTIEDDAYIMSDNRLSLVGVMKRRSFTIGDRIKIKVDFADSETATLDFIVHEKRDKKHKKNSPAKAKAAKKALKVVKKEGKEIREEREMRNFHIDYETEVLWKKAQLKVLKPLLAELGVRGSEARFVRITFEDFWHISISAAVREILRESDQKDFGKYTGAAKYGFENFVNTVSLSLDKTIDNNLKCKYKEETGQIISEFIKNLNKRLSGKNEKR